MHLHSKRVCIFVDGENLRHSIGDLFPSFQNRDYLPKNAKWTEFFDWVAEKAVNTDADRIRTYWYVVENIDFIPYNLNSLRRDNDIAMLEKILSRSERIKNSFRLAITPDKKIEIMNKEVGFLINNQSEMEKRFSGWINLQSIIEARNNSIEFRRAGSIKYDLLERKLGKEKAVDVKLATDLLQLKDIYDVAVILSGDQDYTPAVEAIKDFGKRTVNVSFLTENGKLLPGGAKRLNQTTDWSIEIQHSDLKNHLGF